MHVEYVHPEFPKALIFMSRYLPQFLLQMMALSSTSPKPPKDGVDVLEDPDYNPYEIHEVVPNKLWHIQYWYIAADMGKIMKDVFGLDFLDPTLKDCINDPQIKDLIVSDQNCLKSKMDLSEAELCKKGFESQQDMIVTQLGDTNQLLVYNIC